MLLTIQQIAELKRIVEDYHTAFAINAYGPKTVPPTVLARLQELGLIDYQVNLAQEGYLFGILVQQLNNPAIASLNYPALKIYLKKNPLPLSNLEQQAVNIAASRAAQFVVGLGNRISQDTGQLMVEADAALRLKLQTDIKTTVSQGIAQRQSIQEIKSNMGHAMVDWTRDLDRIAATETSRAMNDGMAAQVRAEHGQGAEVAVQSRRGCCEECQAAYTGPDGAPFIFRLSDLEANGTNYKRNKQERRAVVPPYHPNCACSLIQIDPGDGFDADGDLVPAGTLGIRPHGPIAKALTRALNNLAKGDANSKISWFGLHLGELSPAGNGLRRGRLTALAANRTFACLLGPTLFASRAFVAHQPLGDAILLGFDHPEGAAAALAQTSDPQTSAPPLAWSAVPVHELAGWASGPAQTVTLAKARPNQAAEDRREALATGPLLIPASPPRGRPKVVDADESLLWPESLKDIPKLRVEPTPRRSPLATKPHVQPVGTKIHILGLPTKKDEDEDAKIMAAARQNHRRQPVLRFKD